MTPFLTEMATLAKDMIETEAKMQECLDTTNTHSLEDVQRMIAAGQAKLLRSEDKKAFSVVQVCDYPQRKILHIFLMGGEKESVLGMQDQLLAFAREMNCKSITELGRIGWPRVLKHQGWKHKHAFMELEVGDG